MPRQRYEDPTHTQTLQKAYGRRLRSGFDSITTVIREWVEEDDGLGLELTAVAHPDERDFQFLTDERKVDQFEQWLQDAQEQEVLEVIGRNKNRYVRKAYEKGIENANRDMARQGVLADVPDPSELTNQPVHARTLQQLYTRNYSNLEEITADVADEIREEMTEGFAEGINPREMGRNIRDRVDKVGKHRATLLARTETINAHNEAAYNRYEQVGGPDAQVQVNAEVLTAGDDRVCPICEPKHGQTMTIREARGSAGPIYHPQCRCTVRASFDRT